MVSSVTVTEHNPKTLDIMIHFSEPFPVSDWDTLNENLTFVFVTMAEKYDAELVISRLLLRVYCEDKLSPAERKTLSLPEIDKIFEKYIKNRIKRSALNARIGKHEEARSLAQKKPKRDKSTLKALKPKARESVVPFLVADIETVLINDVHRPYAIGVMMVSPDKPLEPPYDIDTYFSEDHITCESFEERSTKIMDAFLTAVNRLRGRDSQDYLFSQLISFRWGTFIKALGLSSRRKAIPCQTPNAKQSHVRDSCLP